jgi:hypothetical protein
MDLADIARRVKRCHLIQEKRVHVIGCHSAQETRVQSALDDVASNICQALPRAARTRCHRRRLAPDERQRRAQETFL